MRVESVNSNIPFRANKMPVSQAEYLNNKLLNSNSVDIFCHVSTDEDAFQSAVMMYEYLEKNGVKPRIICTRAEKNFGYDEEKYEILNFDSPFQKAETALCLDFSAPERLRGSQSDYLKTFPENSVFGLDHHYSDNPVIKDTVFIKKSSITPPDIKRPVNFYADTTAKSTTSIILRFFEALNKKIPKSALKASYAGMIDDMNKNECVKFDKAGGVIAEEKLTKDKNAYEIYNFLNENLEAKDRAEIIRHLDIFSDLGEDEKTFRKSLFQNIHLTENKKTAYVVIDPDDELFKKIGGDNPVTSKILRDFRIRVLEHKKGDEFLDSKTIEKLKETDSVIVFYPDYKTQRYKMSMHTKGDLAKKIIDYTRENYDKNLTAGGHPNRSGGNMAGLTKKDCMNWARNFISSAQNIPR